MDGMTPELNELITRICEEVDWPDYHRVDATQREQVTAIILHFMDKHYQYEDALVGAIPKIMQKAYRDGCAEAASPAGEQAE